MGLLFCMTALSATALGFWVQLKTGDSGSAISMELLRPLLAR